MNKRFKIGNTWVGENAPAFIVAEISGNHNQDYNRAVEIIHAAKEAGANAVKLQTYTADTITLNCDAPCFQIKEGTIWDGMTLHQLYSEAYMPWDWQPGLKEEANKLGLECFSSPFDFSSVDFLEKMNVPAYKIASYEINDIPLIRKIAALGKPVIFATGIAYPEDIKLAISVCEAEGNKDIILLKCVSAYPTPYDQVNLRVIPTLASTYDCIAGISDHTMGTIVSAGAIPLGAKMIEKHLTLSRKDGGPDAAFSMEPEEFAKMVQEVRILEQALGSYDYTLTDTQKLEHNGSRSLFVVRDIKEGELLTPDNIRSIRPGDGLHTKHYEEILGKKAVRSLQKGTPLAWEMIQ